MNIRPTVVSEGQYPRVTGGPFPDGVGADVNSLYGPRVPFMTPQGMTSDFHSGLDLYRADPPPLVALTRGAVLYAYRDAAVGNWIRVDAGDGWSWDYYHMANPALVKAGDWVNAGDQIGQVGSTGYSTAPHLHLQIAHIRGPVDPLPLLREAAVDVKPLDVSQSIEKVQRFVRNSTAVIADQGGDGMYEIVSGFPGAKPGKEYIVLEMDKGA